MSRFVSIPTDGPNVIVNLEHVRTIFESTTGGAVLIFTARQDQKYHKILTTLTPKQVMDLSPL